MQRQNYYAQMDQTVDLCNECAAAEATIFNWCLLLAQSSYAHTHTSPVLQLSPIFGCSARPTSYNILQFWNCTINTMLPCTLWYGATVSVFQSNAMYTAAHGNDHDFSRCDFITLTDCVHFACTHRQHTPVCQRISIVSIPPVTQFAGAVEPLPNAAVLIE